MKTKNNIYTVGHSNYEIADFLQLISVHKIDVIVDVRQHPYSKYVPHFNKDNIENSLSDVKIKYIFLGELLGARPKDINCYTNDYVDFNKLAKTPFFTKGINRLLVGSEKYRIALMCAEKDPVACHRTILVCRELKKYLQIFHILDGSTLEQHEITEKRLLKLHKLEDEELFRSLEERLEEAYNKQGRKMAASIENA